MVSKYGYLIQIYKVTPAIDFADKVIVQCYVPVVKIVL